MAAFYTVVRFVPDPVMDERINVGVITYDDTVVLARFLTRWNRVRCFGGEDIDFLREFAGDIGEALTPDLVLTNMPGSWKLDEARIQEMSHSWANSIQLSAPRGSLLDAAELLEYCAGRFLREPVIEKREFRTRIAAAGVAARAVSLAIETRFGPKEIDHFLKRRALVVGRLEKHQMDASVGNGVLVAAIQGLSFEGPDTPERDDTITKTAYALEDIHRKNTELKIAVLVLEPLKKSKNYDRALSLLPRVGAEIVTETAAPAWATDVVRRLPEPEKTLETQ